MKGTEQYLKISEFARICGTTKDTLYHYEKIGILKPNIIENNRYRYYSINQFFTFDIISTLKKAGTSLKDIKKYIENQNAEHFLSILKEKKYELENEQRKIEKMKKILQNTIRITEHALQTVCGQPAIEQQEEQYLIIVNLDGDNEKERVSKIYNLYEYCLDRGLSEAFPAGFILNNNNLINRNYEKADYFFCIINGKCGDERFRIKPKGKYAVINHQGAYDNISLSYDKLIDYIKDNHLTITGDAYVHELLGYVAVSDSDKHVIQIAVEVK